MAHRLDTMFANSRLAADVELSKDCNTGGVAFYPETFCSFSRRLSADGRALTSNKICAALPFNAPFSCANIFTGSAVYGQHNCEAGTEIPQAAWSRHISPVSNNLV